MRCAEMAVRVTRPQSPWGTDTPYGLWGVCCFSLTVTVRPCSYAGLTLCHTACRPLPNLCKRLLVENTAITGCELTCVKHCKYVPVFVQPLLPKPELLVCHHQTFPIWWSFQLSFRRSIPGRSQESQKRIQNRRPRPAFALRCSETVPQVNSHGDFHNLQSMNAPPPKGGGFGLRLKSAISAKADVSLLKQA